MRLVGWEKDVMTPVEVDDVVSESYQGNKSNGGHFNGVNVGRGRAIARYVDQTKYESIDDRGGPAAKTLGQTCRPAEGHVC